MLTFISFIEIPLSAVLSITCLIKLIHLFHIKPRRPVLQSFTHGALPLCINYSCYLRLQIVSQKYVIPTKLQLIKWIITVHCSFLDEKKWLKNMYFKSGVFWLYSHNISTWGVVFKETQWSDECGKQAKFSDQGYYC